MVLVIPDVCEAAKVKVREGQAPFWFDRWFMDGPLCDMVDVVKNPSLQIKDV